MKVKEARELLISAEGGEEPSKVNPSLTKSQAIDIIMKGIASMKEDEDLSHLFEKRVYQVIRNQRRPRF